MWPSADAAKRPTLCDKKVHGICHIKQWCGSHASISCLILSLSITGTFARLEMLTAVKSSGMSCHVSWGYIKSLSIHRESWCHHSTTQRMSGELSGTLSVTTTNSPCRPNPKTHCSHVQCCYFPRTLLPPISYHTYLQVSGLHTTFTTSPNPVHYIGLSHWSHSHYKMWSSPVKKNFWM
jgi:hypothetical protein